MDTQNQSRLFGISDDFSEGYQSLDQRFIRNQESTFFFLCKNKDMAPTLNLGDVLIVDRSRKNFLGRVCILEYQGDLLCRRVQKKQGRIFLTTDGQTSKPIILDDSELILWGVVIARANDVL